jgi:aspartokinase/homoserine dehydrogenase 1
MQPVTRFLRLALTVSAVQAFVVPSSVSHTGRRFGLVAAATIDAPAVSENIVDADADSSVTRPKGSSNDWEVHKFGGASLATAELYRTVGDLLIKEAAGRGEGTIPTMAIVSARGGMTDLLVKVVDSALVDFAQAQIALDEAVNSQIALLKELAPPEITDPIEAGFRSDGQDILSVVQSLRMLNTVPAVTMEVVSGFGEIWSAQTLHAYLQTTGVPCEWIDARDVLIVHSDSSGLGEKGAASTGGVRPLYDESSTRMAHWWNTSGRAAGFLDLDYAKESPIVVVTGFVAKTAQDVPTTLKRSGSDYSATIFAKLTQAGRVTMWKNTNGVYTADPRRVPEAFPIQSLKFDEAMELAYFGAQVLHPSAMEPCIANDIPVYVRNIFNPAFEGTVIRGRCKTLKEAVSETNDVKNWRSKSGEIPIKGITSVDKVALVTLEGASIGGAEVAERFMGAMADNDINVLIISQASSESSITIAVPENEGSKALAALEDSFELELSRSTINSVSVVPEMAIIAIVGEGMALTSGVSATFMSSLANANVNIRLIAQGSSERQVAVVVTGAEATRALRAAHMAFTLSETTASVAILGSTGDIGSALVEQLHTTEEMLKKDLGVKICVTVAASSNKMAVCDSSVGLDTGNLAALLADDDAPVFDLDHITNAMDADVNPLRVVIDCTNSEEVSEYYERWLQAGVHIISPSRKVAAGDLERYTRICKAQREHSAAWQFESSVGSSLPILNTIRDLIETGDKIKSIQGCVSGTMAYALSKFSDSMPFSEALARAVDKGYTEADLREDLTGFVSAQKVVILARSLGMDVSIEDVEVKSIIPEDMSNKSYPSEDRGAINAGVVEDMKALDESMLTRLRAAEADDCVLRYKFAIDRDAGKCKCSLEAVPRTDPLFRLKRNENLVAFETSRYKISPLIVKGAAAGPALAAAGVFADILRLTRAYSKNQ